jgi:hypothetical protein
VVENDAIQRERINGNVSMDSFVVKRAGPDGSAEKRARRASRIADGEVVDSEAVPTREMGAAMAAANQPRKTGKVALADAARAHSRDIRTLFQGKRDP